MDNQTSLRVFVTRGDLIESEHQAAVAVVEANGRTIVSAGEADRVAFFRSSAKPFQAIPLIASGAAERFGLSESELAFCCSSHNGMASQQQAVTNLLQKIGGDVGLLQCGAALPLDEAESARVTLGLVPASPLQNCCSGKHSGMLATCFHLGYPIDTYLSSQHPLQLQILDLVAEAMGRESASIALATDGCSLPTFGGTVTEFARSFAALSNPAIAPSDRIRAHESAIARILAAMSGYPENIAGAGSLDTELMRLSNGEIVAKVGAEGLLCMALPKHGLGVAIRMSDGTYRGLNILAITVLEQLGLVESSMLTSMRTLLDLPVTNANGWTVGDFRTDLAI